MKQAIHRGLKLSIAVAMGLGILGAVWPASAQVSSPQPLQDLQTPEKSGDLFSNRSSNPMGNVMDLIHRSVLGPSRNLDEYTADQQENLDTAAAEFRAKQAERLHQGGASPAVAAPVTTNSGIPGSN